MNKISAQGRVYKKISHALRIRVIYQHLINKVTLRGVAAETEVSFNSVRNIIDSYRDSGRTNRKNFKTVHLQNLERLTAKKGNGHHQKARAQRPKKLIIKLANGSDAEDTDILTGE